MARAEDEEGRGREVTGEPRTVQELFGAWTQGGEPAAVFTGPSNRLEIYREAETRVVEVSGGVVVPVCLWADAEVGGLTVRAGRYAIVANREAPWLSGDGLLEPRGVAVADAVLWRTQLVKGRADGGAPGIVTLPALIKSVCPETEDPEAAFYGAVADAFDLTDADLKWLRRRAELIRKWTDNWTATHQGADVDTFVEALKEYTATLPVETPKSPARVKAGTIYYGKTKPETAYWNDPNRATAEGGIMVPLGRDSFPSVNIRSLPASTAADGERIKELNALLSTEGRQLYDACTSLRIEAGKQGAEECFTLAQIARAYGISSPTESDEQHMADLLDLLSTTVLDLDLRGSGWSFRDPELGRTLEASGFHGAILYSTRLKGIDPFTGREITTVEFGGTNGPLANLTRATGQRGRYPAAWQRTTARSLAPNRTKPIIAAYLARRIGTLNDLLDAGKPIGNRNVVRLTAETPSAGGRTRTLYEAAGCMYYTQAEKEAIEGRRTTEEKALRRLRDRQKTVRKYAEAWLNDRVADGTLEAWEWRRDGHARTIDAIVLTVPGRPAEKPKKRGAGKARRGRRRRAQGGGGAAE